MSKLFYANNTFLFSCELSDNDLARTAGLHYDRELKVWATPWAAKAKRILSACENQKEASSIIEKHIAEQKERLLISNRIWTKFEPPKPEGLEFRPYQKAGIEAMLGRRAVLLADPMGLGKTIQAIGLCNCLDVKKILIVCPASVKIKWFQEWTKWTTKKHLVCHRLSGTKVPDVKADVYIMNYDIAFPLKDWLRTISWDVAIFDESHRCKTKGTRRTVAFFGGRYKNKDKVITVKPLAAGIKLCMTGTPIENRPIEFFTTLRYLLPSGFNDEMSFARTYCGLKNTGFGWDMKGATRSEELQELLRSTLMIRRSKEEVLHDLPAKHRSIIEFDPDLNTKKLLQRDAAFWEKVTGANLTRLERMDYDALIQKMKIEKGPDFESMSSLMKEMALAKIPYVIEHIEDRLLETEKIVVFCHHTDVAKAIHEKFKTICVKIVGGMSEKEKHNANMLFQNSGNIRLLVGNMVAAGVGLDMTSSSLALVVEIPWSPGELLQAEDRLHRIGQKKSVLIEHLVFTGTMDAIKAKTIVRKQATLDKTLDVKYHPILEELLK